MKPFVYVESPPAVLPPEMCAPGGQGLAHVSQPAGQVTMVSQFGPALPVGEPVGAFVTE